MWDAALEPHFFRSCVDQVAVEISALRTQFHMLSCVSRVFTIQTVTSGKPPILFLPQHMSEFLKKKHKTIPPIHANSPFWLVKSLISRFCSKHLKSPLFQAQIFFGFEVHEWSIISIVISLVGGLEPWNFMTSHSVGNNHANWRTHIFQKGRLTHQPDILSGSFPV